MKLFSALVLPALLSAIPALSAATFEGVVQMKILDGDATRQLNYEVKGGYMRADIDAGQGHTAVMIIDTKQQRMIVLMPAQNMYIVRPFGTPPGAPAAPAPATPAEAPHATGATKTILGYSCTEYTSQNGGESLDMWITDQLGAFPSLGGAVSGGRGPAPAWAKALEDKGFFPLLITGTAANGRPFTVEVTSIEKKSLPDSLFQPPAGAQEFNPGNMMGAGGMMGGQHP